MRCAVIDVGSNSVLLLALEVSPTGSARQIAAGEAITRLGRGLCRGGRLDPEGRRATKEAVARYARRCEELGIASVWGVATSAVRRAANGLSFAEELTRNTGVPIDIVAGEEEARLVYRAVAAGLAGMARRPLLVADVGGGSTELVFADEDAALQCVASVPIGAVNLTEHAVLGADPPGAEELAGLRAAAVRALDVGPVARAREVHATVVAAGGTATTAAAIDLELEVYDPERVHGHVLSRPRLSGLLDRLAALPLAARRRVRGLGPERAPVIVAGLAIVEALVSLVDTTELVVSERGLRHGLLAEKLAGLGHPLDLRSL